MHRSQAIVSYLSYFWTKLGWAGLDKNYFLSLTVFSEMESKIENGDGEKSRALQSTGRRPSTVGGCASLSSK